MANRRTNQFHHSLQPMLKSIFGQFTVGASSAVSAVSGNGVYNVVKLAAGLWQIILQDNYYTFLNANLRILTPSQGSSVAGGSFVVGTLYQIVTLGTTTTAQWVTAGVPVGIVPAVGVPFVAAAVGAGTGTVKPIYDSGIDSLEIAQSAQLSLNNTNAQVAGAGQGSILILQALANKPLSFTGSTHTNTTVDSISAANVLKMRVGQLVLGPDIPPGTTIAAIASTTSITLSAAATGSNAAEALAVLPARLPSDPVTGSIISFEMMFRDTRLLA